MARADGRDRGFGSKLRGTVLFVYQNKQTQVYG